MSEEAKKNEGKKPLQFSDPGKNACHSTPTYTRTPASRLTATGLIPYATDAYCLRMAL